MTKIIAFVNHKGGVGKTSTTANLGAALAKTGLNILLVDLDAQHNLTDMLCTEEVTATITDALKGGEIAVYNTATPGLKIIASDRKLTGIATQLEKINKKECVLKSILNKLGEAFDYVLLDCPPALNIATINALVAATDVYIITTPEVLPIKGFETITEICSTIKRGYNQKLKISGVIINKYSSRKKLHNNILELLKTKYGNIVFNTKIRENIAITESPLFSLDVITFQPNSNGAKDYINLAKEIAESRNNY